MRPQDLQMVLGWAAAEGWNPGTDDGAAFLAADPAGFLINWVGGQPAAAISVVNHTADFAFLGLYISPPAMRGQGHGWAVWQAGLAHAGARAIGLDGVPDQQANYERSGFVKTGRTLRYRGVVPAEALPEEAALPAPDLQALTARDRAAEGYDRTRFLAQWLRPTPTRQTIALPGGAGFATGRLCQTGIKIGPLQAETPGDAWQLITRLAADLGRREVFVDIPETCAGFRAALKDRGFEPVFDTARMLRGPGPRPALPACYGVATLELG